MCDKTGSSVFIGVGSSLDSVGQNHIQTLLPRVSCFSDAFVKCCTWKSIGDTGGTGRASLAPSRAVMDHQQMSWGQLHIVCC